MPEASLQAEAYLLLSELHDICAMPWGDFEDSWLDDLQEKQAMKQQEEDRSALKKTQDEPAQGFDC